MKPIHCQSTNTVWLAQQVHFIFVFNLFCTIYLLIQFYVFFCLFVCFRIKLGLLFIHPSDQSPTVKALDKGDHGFQHWNKLPNAFRLGFLFVFFFRYLFFFYSIYYVLVLSDVAFPVALEGTMEIQFIHNNSFPAEGPLSTSENHSFEK